MTNFILFCINISVEGHTQMNFRLETMVNTYNAKSKYYLYHNWDGLEHVIFNLTSTKFQQLEKGNC